MRLRARIAAAAVLATVVALPFPALAKQPHAPSLALQVLPDETEASSRTESGRISSLTGRPLSLYRVNYPVRPGTPEQMAREYLVARASQLGLQKADASDLRVVGTRVGEASTTVAFEQTYLGVPVWGSDTAVSMNRQNLVTFVMNGTKTVSLPDVTPTIAMADARARVLHHLQPQGSLQLDRRDLVVYHAKGASRLAWRFRLVSTLGPTGDWEALVDAKTGALFRVQDLSCYREKDQPLVPVNGTATVFAPDPLSSSAGTVYGTGGFVDGAGRRHGRPDGPALDRHAARHRPYGRRPHAEGAVRRDRRHRGAAEGPLHAGEQRVQLHAQPGRLRGGVHLLPHRPFHAVHQHPQRIRGPRPDRAADAVRGRRPLRPARAERARTTRTTRPAPASWPSVRAASTTTRTRTWSSTSWATACTTG